MNTGKKPIQCRKCNRRFATKQAREQHKRDAHGMPWVKSEKMEKPDPRRGYPEGVEPDWTHSCENCGQTPVVPVTGMCGPCTFGEAETIGGNW